MVDWEYEKKRNSLIPKAVKHTNKEVGAKPKKPKSFGRFSEMIKWQRIMADYYIRWNKAYFKEMDRLAREVGLLR